MWDYCYAFLGFNRGTDSFWGFELKTPINMPMTLREFAIVCCISALTFSQDSLATDQSQGQSSDRDISQGQDAATRAPNRLLSTAAVTLRPEDWVKAPEFVPGQMWQFRGKWN